VNCANGWWIKKKTTFHCQATGNETKTILQAHEGHEEKRLNSLTTLSLWSFKNKTTKKSMPPAASFPAFAGTSLKSWAKGW